MRPGRQNLCTLQHQSLGAEAPRKIFIGDTHWSCLNAIVRSQLEHSRLTVLTGEPGAGKTTIVNAAITRLIQHPVRFVRTTSNGLQEVVRHQYEGQQKGTECGSELVRHLDKAGGDATGRAMRACLVFDSVEMLKTDLLHALLQLTDLFADDDTSPLLLLVGRPEVWEALREPALVRLRQRITNTLVLYRLSEEGSYRYVQHIFEVAGARAESVMTHRAIRALVQLGQGNPRRINALALSSLSFTSDKRAVITDRIVERAAFAVDDARQPERRFWSRILFRSNTAPAARPPGSRGAIGDKKEELLAPELSL